MCGIFGEIAINRINISHVATLAKHAKQRGSDSRCLIAYQNDTYCVYRATRSIERLNRRVKIKAASLVLGHSRLITNGLADNQPVLRNDICVLHNGIIVNADHLWAKYKLYRNLQIDTEIIAALV
jgi:glucosamine 6-phosphate synthetase-like amidotransferase/phosphosugar isomerase protein